MSLKHIAGLLSPPRVARSGQQNVYYFSPTGDIAGDDGSTEVSLLQRRCGFDRFLRSPSSPRQVTLGGSFSAFRGAHALSASHALLSVARSTWNFNC
jgi:hypothetical protein